MSETKIHVRGAEKKIEFCEYRIKLLSQWDAPKSYQRLRDHCISTLRNRIIFLQDHGVVMEKIDRLPEVGETINE